MYCQLSRKNVHVDKTILYTINTLDGFEVLKVIRKHKPYTKVIMLSSQEKHSIVLIAVAKGAEQYVIKDEDPFVKIPQTVEQTP